MPRGTVEDVKQEIDLLEKRLKKTERGKMGGKEIRGVRGEKSCKESEGARGDTSGKESGGARGETSGVKWSWNFWQRSMKK
ncbi:hypothetical protein NDU88_002887 [Pleurodeles waltl]|uniref:Uncharacterized protein n=1 Tax=Pleurodeles waltl TaxID=8319 RepID=A0AAV7VEI6_PLEWA|nr:hypothetical protein NDU88_002887 [Pleurodeles waltl]